MEEIHVNTLSAKSKLSIVNEVHACLDLDMPIWMITGYLHQWGIVLSESFYRHCLAVYVTKRNLHKLVLPN